MNSFYGGKQGRTYHIVERFDCVDLKSFDRDYVKYNGNGNRTISLVLGNIIKNGNNYYSVSVEEIGTNDTIQYTGNNANVTPLTIKGMVQQFQKGGQYTDVNYGQYVIIDTIKNLGHYTNDENGLLFRRGLNYLENINLNQSKKPNKNSEQFFDNGPDQTTIFNQARWQLAWSAWVQSVGGGAIYEGQIVGPRGGVGELKGVQWSELTEESQRQEITVDLSQSGSVIDTNDSDGIIDYINFGVAEVKEPNGDIVGHKISFKFYKPQIRVQAQQVSPYGRQSLTFQDSVTKDETAWYIDFEQPGESVSPSGDPNYSLIKQSDGSSSHPFYYNYQIAVPHGKKGDSVESFQVTTYNVDKTDPENPIYNIEDIPEGTSLTEGYQYLTYKIINYNTNENGDISGNKLIDKYNIISNITPLNKTRSVITQTSAGFDVGSLARNSKWSQNNIYLICLSKGNNPGSIPINNSVPTVGEVINSNNGTSIWKAIYIPGTAALTGFKVQFTADAEKNFNFVTIDYLYMDNKGNIYTVYSNSDSINKVGNIPVVEEIIFDDFTNFPDKPDSSFDPFDPDEEYTGSSTFKTKIVKDGINSDIDIISSPINYPVDIQRHGDILYVLYSNPKYRSRTDIPFQNLTYTFIDKNNKIQIKTFPYQIYQLTPSDIHIFGGLENEQVRELLITEDPEETGSYIYGKYAKGIDKIEEEIENQGNQQIIYPYQDRAGWIITIEYQENGEDKIDYYAYDYINATSAGRYPFEYRYKTQQGGVETQVTISGQSNWYKVQTKTNSINLNTYYIISEENETNNNIPKNELEGSRLLNSGIWFVLR